jgi:flagellar hook protein FlgE
MIGALYNGISGLNGFQTGLNTQSNNMSNINTIGFKSDQISFADQMYQMGVGRGVKVDEIKKDFTQGNLKITDNPYDMAISGSGYFIVQGDTQELLYTRAGNFRMAEDGFLKTVNGLTLKGFANITNDVLSSDVITSFTNDYNQFMISSTVPSVSGSRIQTFNAKTTDYTITVTDDNPLESGNNYKTKQSKTHDIEALKTSFVNAMNTYAMTPVTGVASTSQISTVTFDETLLGGVDLVEMTVGNNIVSVEFESDSETTLRLLTDKISQIQGVKAQYNNGSIEIENLVLGEELVVDGARIKRGENYLTPLPTIVTTTAVEGNGYADVLAKELALKTAIENAGGKYLRINSAIDGTTTVLSDIQMNLETLNISTSPFGDFEMDDGYLYMKQGDNRFIVGQLQTAIFPNQIGLNPQGGNLFSATLESGEPILATVENEILANTIELANSELGESLVDLMVYQRAFEASSKSISTSDEFLKTAIALKK